MKIDKDIREELINIKNTQIVLFLFQIVIMVLILYILRWGHI
jgi:hypothetical protein